MSVFEANFPSPPEEGHPARGALGGLGEVGRNMTVRNQRQAADC